MKKYVISDYAQIEVRIAAYVSHDPTLLKIMQADPKTAQGDVHARNVQALFGIPFEEQKGYPAERVRAKNFLFGALYGSHGYAVQRVLEQKALDSPELGIEVPSLSEIRMRIRQVRDKYAKYFYEWVPFALHEARERGNIALTLFDRPRMLPDLASQEKSLREAAERECISQIIQGTAADILRMANIKVAGIPNGTLVLTVHDELGSIVDEEFAEEYMKVMNQTMQLGQPFEDVPLIVDSNIGDTWRDCHK